MNKDLIHVIEQIGREKGIGKEVLFEAVESALLSASKKTMGLADNVRMELDRHTGALRVYARKKVVENEEFGNHAAIGCHLANYSYFKGVPAVWDGSAKRIKG